MTKKRIFSVLAILLIAATVTAAGVGCTFIRENDYRAANETYATVNHNGITLTISYNEFIDYFNSMGYYYVNYYGYTVEEALDLTISNKIQQKYLLTEAMVYLTDANSVSAERIASLYGGGAHAKPEDVLTYAERLAAIYAVNDSILSSVEETAEESRQSSYTSAMNRISAENVAGIELSAETESYFQNFFHDGAGCYVGQELDLSRVKIVVRYDDGSVSDPFIVPASQYTTEFSSEASDSNSDRTEDKEFVITFSEDVEGEDGEATTEEHTLTYEYTLIYPRETLEEDEDETDYTEVTIGDFDPISRYAAADAIAEDIRNASVMYASVEAMRDSSMANADSFTEDAWRQIIENVSSANKDMAYFYNSQFESQALSALQAELYNEADGGFTLTDAAVAEEYRYLYTTGRDSYTGTAEENKDAFIDAIGEGIDSLYYYPAVENISGYYYVYQILFQFTDEQAAFLEELGDDEAAIAEFTELFFQSLTTEASNPDFDAETYDPEDPEAEGPFTGVEEKVSEVIARLQDKLKDVYDDETLTAADRSARATEIFLDYLYRYNDDPGIFNNDYGYLMTPDPEDSGWVDAFNELGAEIFSYNNAALGGAGVVGNAFNADGTLAWKASNYGIHLMMISATPFAGVTGELTLPSTDAEIVTYLKGRVNPASGESMYDTIADALKTENRTAVYNAFVSGVPTELFTRNDRNKLKLNDGIENWLSVNAGKIKREIYDVLVG